MEGGTSPYAYSGSLYGWVKETAGGSCRPRRPPRPGDAVLYGRGPSASEHVGIVESVLGGEIVTIEGNFGNRVARVGPFPPALAVAARRAGADLRLRRTARDRRRRREPVVSGGCAPWRSGRSTRRRRGVCVVASPVAVWVGLASSSPGAPAPGASRSARSAPTRTVARVPSARIEPRSAARRDPSPGPARSLHPRARTPRTDPAPQPAVGPTASSATHRALQHLPWHRGGVAIRLVGRPRREGCPRGRGPDHRCRPARHTGSSCAASTTTGAPTCPASGPGRVDAAASSRRSGGDPPTSRRRSAPGGPLPAVRSRGVLAGVPRGSRDASARGPRSPLPAPARSRAPSRTAEILPVTPRQVTDEAAPATPRIRARSSPSRAGAPLPRPLASPLASASRPRPRLLSASRLAGPDRTRRDRDRLGAGDATAPLHPPHARAHGERSASSRPTASTRDRRRSRASPPPCGRSGGGSARWTDRAASAIRVRLANDAAGRLVYLLELPGRDAAQLRERPPRLPGDRAARRPARCSRRGAARRAPTAAHGTVRAELVLAGPRLEPLARLALDPDPLTPFAARASSGCSRAGERSSRSASISCPRRPCGEAGCAGGCGAQARRRGARRPAASVAEVLGGARPARRGDPSTCSSARCSQGPRVEAPRGRAALRGQFLLRAAAPAGRAKTLAAEPPRAFAATADRNRLRVRGLAAPRARLPRLRPPWRRRALRPPPRAPASSGRRAGASSPPRRSRAS